jgi:hypothetical protein
MDRHVVGVGHTVTIVLVGTAIILIDWIIGPQLSLAMELIVGLMLIGVVHSLAGRPPSRSS